MVTYRLTRITIEVDHKKVKGKTSIIKQEKPIQSSSVRKDFYNTFTCKLIESECV